MELKLELSDIPEKHRGERHLIVLHSFPNPDAISSAFAHQLISAEHGIQAHIFYQETVKELAQLDGAFIVSDDGVVLSAARYINASAEGIDLPLGLGSRHMAAASITKHTHVVAVVVSESSVVRIFDDGKIVAEVIPELWSLRQHGIYTEDPFIARNHEGIRIVRTKEQPENKNA